MVENNTYFHTEEFRIQYQNLGTQYTVDDVHIDLTIPPVFSSWDRANGCSSPCQFFFIFVHSTIQVYSIL